jgi:hypothetical protein
MPLGRLGACLAVLAIVNLPRAHSLDNGLGSRPGLGWNSDYANSLIDESTGTIIPVGSDGRPILRGWTDEGEPILRGFQNEKYIIQLATFMNTSGTQALGYWSVNMDAGWNTMSRDSSGNLVPDPAEWPSGLNYTIAAVHALGLGFGLYGDRGTKDCSGRPGQQGYEQQDADFFASQKIDWFKMDSCYAPADEPSAVAQYAKMRDALNATGRHIWFALCGWEPWYAPVGKSLGNSWRIGVDTGSGWAAVMSNIDAMLNLAQYAGPTSGGGGWNDMSLLLTPGMGSGPNLMSNERHRSQFNFHCIYAANMLMTSNLSNLAPYVYETWTNPEAVAVNQDPAGNPFVVLHDSGEAAGRMWTPEGPISYVFATVAECGGEPAYQNWTFGVPVQGFLQNPASNQCLNVDNCQSQIIYDGCTYHGVSCGGGGQNSSYYPNEQWTLTEGGALVSRLPGNRCATVGSDNSVSLYTCADPLPANQTWKYDASTGELSTGQGLCLTASSPAPPPSYNATLLVGREMHDGTWAVAALNNLPENTTVVCGPDCFAAMNISSSSTVRVRDLWAHADINTTLATALDIPVGANGTSTLWKLTIVG